MVNSTTRENALEYLETCVEQQSGYELSLYGKERLLHICDLVDLLYAESEGNKVEIYVDPSKTFGMVFLYVSDIILQGGRTHPFFEFGKFSDYIDFKKSAKNEIRVGFMVKNLWIKGM